MTYSSNSPASAAKAVHGGDEDLSREMMEEKMQGVSDPTMPEVPDRELIYGIVEHSPLPISYSILEYFYFAFRYALQKEQGLC